MVFPGHGMGWGEFLKTLKSEWKKDNISDAAGALTYFAVLALFPFLVFIVSMAGLVMDPAQAEALSRELGKVAPSQAAEILSERLHSLARSNNGGLLTVGGLGALWAASGGVFALMRALNSVYDVEETRPFWKARGIALLGTMLGAVLVLVSALVMVAAPAFADALGGPFRTIILWGRLPVAGLVMMLVWALAYYFLPDVEQRFKFITPGSVLGVVLWLGASLGFSVYVSNFGKYEATYGALGGVIVMLLWMWISAQVILLGAQINSILEHSSPEGKRAGAKRLADSGASDPNHPERSPASLSPKRPEAARPARASALRRVAVGAVLASAALVVRRLASSSRA